MLAVARATAALCALIGRALAARSGTPGGPFTPSERLADTRPDAPAAERPVPVRRDGPLRGRGGPLHQLGGDRLPGRAGAGRHAGADQLLDVGAGPRHGAVHAAALAVVAHA